MRRLLLLIFVVALAFSPVSTSVFAQSADSATAPSEQPTAAELPADTIAPVISMPENLVVAAADATGVIVSYTLPTASDDVSGPVAVGCDFPPGTLFPLGTTTVTCSAQDAAGNGTAGTFTITVQDQTPPIISVPGGIVVDAVDPGGATVAYDTPTTSDNVDGWDAVTCDSGSGAFFPIGTTTVTCSAQDAADNAAIPASFTITVNAPPPPPPPPPTLVPTMPPPTPEPTLPPVPPAPTVAPTTAPASTLIVQPTAAPTDPPPPTMTPRPQPPATRTQVPSGQLTTPPPRTTATATTTPQRTPSAMVSAHPSPISTATLTVSPAPTAPGEPVDPPFPSPTMAPLPSDASPTITAPQTSGPDAYELPALPPANIEIVTNGGPLGILTEIWNYLDFPISQEFGHTDFSVGHFSWYSFGLDYGLDGYEHSGIDIGMPAGTLLYSPVDGTVELSGNTPYYTFYGNGNPNVGELLIQTDDGNEVILGHMSRIAVNVGDRVRIGQFVGLSGGFNGDHVHLETREILPGGGYRIVDPRKSFLIATLSGAAHPGPGSAIPAGHRPHLQIPAESGRRLVQSSKISAFFIDPSTVPRRVPVLTPSAPPASFEPPAP